MEAKVPVKTGNLRTSLGVKVESSRVIIGPDERQAPYGGYVEFGTGPHVIRPKTKKVLSFVVNGKRVFATKVNHPGTKAQPYVRPAFDAAEICPEVFDFESIARIDVRKLRRSHITFADYARNTRQRELQLFRFRRQRHKQSVLNHSRF